MDFSGSSDKNLNMHKISMPHDTYDDLGLGQLSNRNRKLKIAGCVTERYHSFARDFDILRSISKMSFLNITHQHTPTRLFYSAH